MRAFLIAAACAALSFTVACGGGGSSSMNRGSATCTATTATPVGLTQQVQNPVSMFPQDNNGVILELPSILSPSGAFNVPGFMVFGIGTEANNSLGSSATVLNLNSAGMFTTTFNGVSYPNSFVDSGSNGLFFPNTLNISTTCTSSAGFYCPSSPVPSQATPGTASPVDFTVVSADQLFSGTNTAFNDLAGPSSNLTGPSSPFDWGLPFFFGNNVFTNFENQSGNGAYVAYIPNPSPSVSLQDPNVVQITVDAGPTGLTLRDANTVFVSIKICVPNTSTCQTIDHVLVDTGSSGLRIFNSALTLSLPAETVGGNPLANCARFVDSSFLWGSVRTADITLGGETASAVPIQVIGDPAFPTVAPACSTGGHDAGNLNALGSNGILGVGIFLHDCGSGCVSGTPGPYWACSSSGQQGSSSGNGGGKSE